MRSILPFLVLSLALTAAVPAQELRPVPAAKVEQSTKQRLDELFLDLKRANKEPGASQIASRIWEAWGRSGSASIDLMMQWSKEAMDKQKFDVSLDFLDQVTAMKPDYAEGFNRRATVHFMMHNYAKSMADIEKTLELEPRHFGALSGMAQILKARGNKELALSAYLKVLDVYPMMRNAQTEVSTLSEDLAGNAI